MRDKTRKHTLQEPQPRLSKQDVIAEIERRLADKDISNREFASLSKRWANLTGNVKQGQYVRQPSQKLEPEPEDVTNDRQVGIYETQERAFSADSSVIRWWRLFAIEALTGQRPITPAL